MKKWKAYCTGLLALAGLSPSAMAQIPAIPAAPAVAATPVGGLHQFLGLTPEAMEAKRRRKCATQLGQLINNTMAPLRAFTGGVLGNFCPITPSAADLLKPGAEGAASKIQKDEAEAKARRAAVRYLGTVDCHFWPDAEAALIASLRADKNECVRWEAAMALGKGCCCTKRTIEALLISATCSEKDGNPSETCERVRAAAFGSLQHCLACFHETVPAEKKDSPEKVPESDKSEKPVADGSSGNVQLTAYYQKLDQKPMAQVVREARQTVGETTIPTGSMTMPTGYRGLANVFVTAFGKPTTQAKASTGEGKQAATKEPDLSNPLLFERTPHFTPRPIIDNRVVFPEAMAVPSSGALTPIRPNSIEKNPVEMKPIEVVPMESKPPAAKFPEAKPLGLKPLELRPLEAKPIAMVKGDIKPLETKPPDTKPVEFRPMIRRVEVKTVEAKPIDKTLLDSKPIEFKPIEQKSIESKPVGMKPLEFNSNVKLVSAKPTDLKPLVTATAETKTTERKPMPAAPLAVRSFETKPVDMKPLAIKPPDAKPAHAKFAEATVTAKKSTDVIQVAAKPSTESYRTIYTTAPSVTASTPRVVTATAQAPAPSPAVASTAANGSNPQQLLLVLRNSSQSVQREWAVDNLSNMNVKSNPEVVQSLLTAAQTDSDSRVRVRCIRALATMRIDAPPVIAGMRSLRSDADPRITHEAELALTVMGSQSPSVAASRPAVAGNVQPTSYFVPANVSR